MASKVTAADVKYNRLRNVEVTEEQKEKAVKMMKPDLLGLLTTEEYQDFKNYRVKYLQQLFESESLKAAQDLHQPLTELLEYSFQLDGGSGNMLFLSLYKHYCKNPTKEQMELAYFYAWNQAAMFTIYWPLDDIMDKAVLRRFKPTYYLKVGQETATMLITLAFNVVYESLALKFQHEPFVNELLRRWTYYCTLGTAGQTLESWGSHNQEKMWSLSFRNHHNFFRSSPVHDLPLEAAVIMSGHKLNPGSLDFWRSMMKNVNSYLCNTNDYNDVYPKVPTGKLLYVDIVNGTPTWCSGKAWDLANEKQRQVLKDNYGHDDNEKIAMVLQVYDDVNLKDHFSTSRRAFIQKILLQADKCPEDLAPKALLRQLFNGVMKEHGLVWN